MFTIAPMPACPGAETLGRLAQIETATFGHILHAGFPDRAIAAVVPGKRVAGRAITVRIAGADSTLLHYAVGMAGPGDVLVIDRCGDDRHACWGGVTATAAHLRGISGIVIDGPATDFAEIRRLDLPVWCRGQTALTTKFLTLPGAINVPVQIGGTTVTPGDAILADDCGVVVLDPSALPDLMVRAEAMEAREPQVIARLRAGEALADISGATGLLFPADV
ncbi:RraA family protein [Sphingobium sp. YR768]|uniref:RraA family protein n=1 Tax=Sphingobium sp. YR768 TaxID=1884365 RepID=UPI0008B2C5FE|nr:RraA family protein [Sphingobium sp. YR768]SER26402.1 Regulator of RNase E activity RraA [Sphingobium sp. YR768]